MCLLIDIGNSRVKWGVREQNGIRSGPPFFLASQSLSQCFEQAWKRLERPARVIVSNVAGPDMARQIRQWINLRWKLEVELARPQRLAYGVRIAYSDPSKLGVDRWVCLLALRHFYALPACVVDCGTAITLDVLDKTGTHRGGVIMPGIGLMKTSLLQRTSDIVDSGSTAGCLLADSTGAAIQSGTMLAAAGMVEKVLGQLDAESDASLPLILTGGDAEKIAPQLPASVVMAPDLVLQGLAVMA